MNQQPPHPSPGFQVLQEYQRQLSVNHSVISTLTNNLSTYQQLHDFFKEFSSEKIDIQALHQSQHLKLKKYKEAIYYGEYINGHRQGKGIMLYHSEQRYEGDWSHDQRHGNGYEIFANGAFYEGEYQNNKMHGQGKYCWPGGEVYEGEWFNNIKHGTGMWINSNGDSYAGQWKEGKATGFGVFIQEKVSTYQGSFIEFVKNGKGTEKFLSGDSYKGAYQDGFFQGFGEYYWKGGSFYKGQFKKGLKHGYGIWKKGQTGEKYEGEFIQNRKQGYGIYTWTNGNIYKGHYQANLRHGNGEMFWSDGTFYKGSWLVDKPNGKGLLFDGQEATKGIFQDGILVELDHPEDDHKGISEFYQDNPPTSRRMIVTPIRKITQEPTERYPNRRLLFSQVEKDAQVREIRKTRQGHRSTNKNPLKKQSFVRRKLMQTISQQPPQRSQPKAGRTVQSRSQSRQKVLHSAFQIHRLYKNHNLQLQNSDNTADNKDSFAFARQQTRNRPRYYSKLQ